MLRKGPSFSYILHAGLSLKDQAANFFIVVSIASFANCTLLPFPVSN